MLVLTRKQYEAILIGPDIRVSVTWIGMGRVRIGIDAPRGVEIVRAELVDRASSNIPLTEEAKAGLGRELADHVLDSPRGGRLVYGVGDPNG